MTLLAAPAMAALACAAAGVTYAASLAPLGWWPVQYLALAALFGAACAAPGARQALLCGGAFCLGAGAAGSVWIGAALVAHTGYSAGLGTAIWLGLVAAIALPTALVPVATAWAARRGGPLLAPAVVFCSGWTLAEYARSLVWGGLPWMLAGYAHVDGPLRGYAPLAGSYAVSTLAAACAVCLYGALTRARPLARAAAAAALVAIHAIGWQAAQWEWSRPTGVPVSIRLLQSGLMPQWKFAPAAREALVEGYLNRILARPAGLVVLPETALPFPFHELPAGAMRRLHDHVNKTGATVLIGLFTDAAALGPRNSLYAFGPQGVSRYDKRHLLPLGERVPVGLAWLAESVRVPLGELTAGAAPGRVELGATGIAVGLSLCYEDAFQQDIAESARDAGLLLNAGDLSWFADPILADQHLQVSRMRALENSRPLLATAAYGVTALVDHRGRVVERLPLGADAELVATMAPRTGTTPFARLATWHPLLPLLHGLAMVGALILAARHAHSGKRESIPNTL